MSNRATILVGCLLCAWALVAAAAAALAEDIADDAPTVTPYRPTVSTPAALSAPGWLEIESGWITTGAGLNRRQSLPYSLKLAFSPDWGIRVDGEAAVAAFLDNGNRSYGLGDTSFVLKRRFSINDRSAFGMELQIGTPTAKEPFQSVSGRTDYTINSIYSADLSETYHVDLNYAVTRLGVAAPAQGQEQNRWVAAVSRTLPRSWALAGELSGTSQAGAEQTRQILLAASYTSSRSVCWDFGVARGLTAASPQWSVFAGVTVLAFRFL